MNSTKQGGNSDLRTRVISVAVAMPIFLVLVALGGWWLGIAILLLILVSAYEYLRLCRSMTVENLPAWLVLGLAYLVMGFCSLLALRLRYDTWLATLWLLATVWITDSGAYFVGRRWGRRPLAPLISPHKTWEGAIGGAVAGSLLAAILLSLGFHLNYFLCVFLTLLTSSAGQIGDLLESKAKRLAGVKDSGKLLPGHGGALDRFDSILLASPVALVLLLLL